MDTIAKRGKIVIGVKYDVPLFGLLDPASRKVDGLDVAFGKAIAAELGLNDIGRVALRVASPLAVEPYAVDRTTGAFLVVDDATGTTLGAGMVG